MIIYADLQSNMSISFEVKDFQRINMHYKGKTALPPWGPHLLTEQVCFSNLGRGSLDDRLCQSTI